ncbi:hypothetical protein L1049_015118 [Liquidambar formosana]|uniref:Uncharacterized protein n=1 Tax=Liquidambar formosana TaxID=63359 RepID=A0AAP0S4C1_LIQFO
MTTGSSRLLFLISAILIILVRITTAQEYYLLFAHCSESAKYSRFSPYMYNLNAVFNNISSNTQIDYGFYNFSVGENSNKVNAIALCRGDVSQEACRGCIDYATREITRICPDQMEAIAWYDNCTLRYSNRTIFGTVELRPHFYWWIVDNASNVIQFNQTLRTLLANLQIQAASGGSLRKFATAEANFMSFETVYALVQCTPDLTDAQCSNCLDGAIAAIPDCCEGKQGGRILFPSCNLRWSISQFYESTPDAPPPQPSTPDALPPLPSTPPPPTKGKESNTSRTVIAVVATVTSLILIVCICIFLRMRKRRETVEMDEIGSVESLQFDFGTIRVATEFFSDANKLGQGGFGAVYKGKLPNGQDIAVKRLSTDSGQGDQEFKNEVLLVAKLQHRNLVRLLGFCMQGKERLLIYEFVPNTSLDHYLFNPIKREQLDWERRYQIIGGISRGLLYLHEDSRLRIIHRDLKASNILLDAEMNPKIADFGMARLFVVGQTQGTTNRIVGTYGYMAPEYAMHGYFSVKSDVYSFGVLVLEIVSGQKNSYRFRNGEDVKDLLSYAWKNWREGIASNLIDPTLRNGSMNEIVRCIHIGLLCVQENEVNRPTMASVVQLLSSPSLTLPVPSEPAFFMQSKEEMEMPLLPEHNLVATSSDQSQNQSSSFSVNEVSITKLYPR